MSEIDTARTLIGDVLICLGGFLLARSIYKRDSPKGQKTQKGGQE